MSRHCCYDVLLFAFGLVVGLIAMYFLSTYTAYGLTYAWYYKTVNMTTGCPYDTSKYPCTSDNRISCYNDQYIRFYTVCPTIGIFPSLIIVSLLLWIIMTIYKYTESYCQYRSFKIDFSLDNNKNVDVYGSIEDI